MRRLPERPSLRLITRIMHLIRTHILMHHRLLRSARRGSETAETYAVAATGSGTVSATHASATTCLLRCATIRATHEAV
jgi:hypothetical protein